MCVSGRPIKAAEALQPGLIDRIVDGDLVAGRGGVRARDGRARRTASRRRASAPTSCRAPRRAAGDARGRPRAGREDPAATRRRRSRAVDAIEAAATLPFDEGCRRERELFFECVAVGAGQGADPRVLRRARAWPRCRASPRTRRRRRSRRVGHRRRRHDGRRHRDGVRQRRPRRAC